MHDYATGTSNGFKGVPAMISVIWVGEASDGSRAEIALQPTFSVTQALSNGFTHKQLADLFGPSWGNLPTTGDCDIDINVRQLQW